MTRPSRSRLVRAVMLKDLREMARDRLWVILTPMAMAMFAAVFHLLPSGLDEVVRVGVHPPQLAGLLTDLTGADGGHPGLSVVPFESEEELSLAVTGRSGGVMREAEAGVSVPGGLAGLSGVGAGVGVGAGAAERARVTVYLSEGVPPLVGSAVSSAVTELAYATRSLSSLSDPFSALPVRLPDLSPVVATGLFAGTLPFRELLRPLMAMVVLMMEAIALAGLVSVEMERRTASALLVTPLRVGDLLAAKCLTGLLLATVQALLLLLVTGTPVGQLPLLAVLVLAGGLMASAVGMLAGSAGRGFMGTLFLSVFLVFPLMVPALATLFPASPPLAVRLLPSFGLVRGLISVSATGAGWADTLPLLAATLAWASALLAVALPVLRRRMTAS